MFRFFNAPRVSYIYSRPTIYRQRINPIESYLLNSIRQAQEYERYKYLIQRAMIEQREQEEENRNEKEQHNENININEEKIDNKEDQIIEEKRRSQNIPIYYFESHSRFDGEKLVEERKERKVDSEGKVHRTLKRRLGDQWYQTEQIKDKEGKETVKEAWHNVAEEDIDIFKQEWIKQIGYQNKEIENEQESPENEEKVGQQSEKNETGNENEIKDQNEKEKLKNETSNETNNENEVKDQKEKQISNDDEKSE